MTRHERYNCSAKGQARYRRYRETEKGRANERRSHLRFAVARRESLIQRLEEELPSLATPRNPSST